jgi:predicted ATPase with chaperone activity
VPNAILAAGLANADAITEKVSIRAVGDTVHVFNFATAFTRIVIYPETSKVARRSLSHPPIIPDQPCKPAVCENVGGIGYNMLMVGPRGSGKTMLAKRVPTILPKSTAVESIETTRIYSAMSLMEGKRLRRSYRCLSAFGVRAEPTHSYRIGSATLSSCFFVSFMVHPLPLRLRAFA